MIRCIIFRRACFARNFFEITSPSLFISRINRALIPRELVQKEMSDATTIIQFCTSFYLEIVEKRWNNIFE